MLGGTIIDQATIDRYYENKKSEVSRWLKEYIYTLKRISKQERQTLLDGASTICFSNAYEYLDSVLAYTTISQRDKKRIAQYIGNIDWLPEDEPVGFLDNRLVTRIQRNNHAKDLFNAAFGPWPEVENEKHEKS